MSSTIPRTNSDASLASSPRTPSSSSSSSGSGIHFAPAASFPSPMSTTSRSTARRRPARLWRKTHAHPDDLNARTPWFDTPVGKSTLRKTRWTCLGFSSPGLLSAAALIVTAWLSVPKHEYCLVLNEQFDGDTLDSSIWHHEVQVGGFGNGEFEMTTTSPNNSYVEDGKLIIAPTLTSDRLGVDAITNGFVMNLTADGTCTSDKLSDCVAFSNSTVGNYSVIPPIQSARLTTRLSKSIRFGRVEVKAKMPTGDWIWPAIWMLPRDNVYGEWPASGEIDIVETRGNRVKHSWDRTVNAIGSALHWGLDFKSDRYKDTTGQFLLKRRYVDEAYYTYGLDWDPKGMRFWNNQRSRAIKRVNFDQTFWDRGSLSSAQVNGSIAVNPWEASANVAKAAPFDQDFYLILSVAVGGTNGWFPDSGDKPWSNGAPNAARDFWNNRAKWQETWPEDPKERGMTVESVKSWRIKEKGETCAA
ncbi:glycoside hydrolase family 16 protein [Rhodotorula graminis WP1]|uniref:Glycoside hydrolase family 16 protein n=1 Tax=Rhodotorula graminis (strain WP1) TaxID=578459 RepID=A0A0P9F2G7_RHOGW|nr:glycoside hydrolase family 16 protein [Rhodotorula graminis WP1]KPV73980.1 glycoside hydrolase family 16 protein [Rhodotorula graminis WP1]